MRGSSEVATPVDDRGALRNPPRPGFAPQPIHVPSADHHRAGPVASKLDVVDELDVAEVVRLADRIITVDLDQLIGDVV